MFQQQEKEYLTQIMKRLLATLIGICILMILAGCATPPVEFNGENSTDTGNTSVEKTLFVGPERVDCVGVAPQKCYKVREDPSEDWRFFYSEIAGFDYEPGYQYELLVREEKVENPPADGSSLRWELIEVVSKEAADNTGE